MYFEFASKLFNLYELDLTGKSQNKQFVKSFNQRQMMHLGPRSTLIILTIDFLILINGLMNQEFTKELLFFQLLISGLISYAICYLFLFRGNYFVDEFIPKAKKTTLSQRLSWYMPLIIVFILVPILLAFQKWN
jgi:uncharacterized ion transporter superfamily protein YfcC